MSLRLLKRRFVGVGPEVLEGKRKPRWVSCRVKRASQLRKAVEPRFKKDIHGWGLSEMLKSELVMRVTAMFLNLQRPSSVFRFSEELEKQSPESKVKSRSLSVV